MVTQSDLYVLEAAARREKAAGNVRMAVRTSTVVEIGGDGLLNEEDKRVFEELKADRPQSVDDHTCSVEVDAILTALESYQPPVEA